MPYSQSEAFRQLWNWLTRGDTVDPATGGPSITTSALLWTDGTLVAASGNVVSGWIDVSGRNVLRIGRTHAGGAYAFEIDWGRSSGVSDFTEAVTVTNNTTLEKPVAAAWARFRVRNTDAVTAFSAHRTNVVAR